MSHASDIVLGGLVLKLESYPLPSRRIHYEPIHIDSPLANEAFWTMNSPVLELKVVSPEYMRLPHPTTETKGHTYQQEVAFEPELIGKHKHLADVFGNEDEEHQFVPDKLVNPALLTPLPVLDILPNSNNRTGIMRRFVPDYENSVNLASVACGRNEDVPLSQLPQSKKLLVTCGELEFTRPELYQIEPLFPEICLYNYETGEVLSEVFHFDDNPTELLCTHLLESRIVQHVTSTSHHALFEIADLSSNVGLLVRVNRTLQGNPDVFNDYYCREKMVTINFHNLLSNMVHSLRETLENSNLMHIHMEPDLGSLSNHSRGVSFICLMKIMKSWIRPESVIASHLREEHWMLSHFIDRSCLKLQEIKGVHLKLFLRMRIHTFRLSSVLRLSTKTQRIYIHRY